MNIKKIQAALRTENLAHLATAIGVHYNTLRAIRNGTNNNPTLKTLTAITGWLNKNKA